MKFTNKLLCLSVVGLSLCLSSCSKWNSYSQAVTHKYVYAGIDENTMPISGWVSPYGAGNTDENFRLMKEAGFTSIYGCKDSYVEGSQNTEVMKSLQYAQNHGIKYVVIDRGLFNYKGDQFKEKLMAREYMQYDSYGGVMYGDEPLEDTFDKIATDAAKWYQYAPKDKIFYVNMLPCYAAAYNNSAHKYETYEENYLRAFLKKAKTPFLSYDSYSLIEDPFDPYYIRDEHFYVLQSAAKVSLEEGVPFWAFGCSTEHVLNNSGVHYRNPSENEFYWQVNSALAYGAKGIQYFCYQDPDTTNTRETYGLGGSFLKVDGTLGDSYEKGKKMNAYIHSIDHILMNANLLGQLVNDTKTQTRYLAPYNQVTSIRDVTSLESSNDIIVSAMEYEKKTVYFAFNFSLSTDATFTLNFNSKFKTKCYPMNEETFVNDKSNSLTYTLAPGHALLIEPTK